MRSTWTNLGYFSLLHSFHHRHCLINRVVAIFTQVESETPVRRHEAATYDLSVLLDDLWWTGPHKHVKVKDTSNCSPGQGWSWLKGSLYKIKIISIFYNALHIVHISYTSSIFIKHQFGGIHYWIIHKIFDNIFNWTDCHPWIYIFPPHSQSILLKPRKMITILMKQQFSFMHLIKILAKHLCFISICIFYSYLWHCCSEGKIHDFFHHLPSLGKMDDAHTD